MILDLLRNDLGRIARAGVGRRGATCSMLERYETVWQLTSTVLGELAPGVDLADVFRGALPVRLGHRRAQGPDHADHRRARGLAAGRVLRRRRLPLAAGIAACRRRGSTWRSARSSCDAETGSAEYGVGGGITWDSRAASEYDEVVAKARVLTARRPRFDLFETLRHDPGGGLLTLERHLARLRALGGLLRVPVRRGARRGRARDRAARHGTTVRPGPVTLDRRGAVTAKARRCRPHRSPSARARHGRTRRPVRPRAVPQDLSASRYEDAAARHPDADDVVLSNTRGEITETTIANVAVQLDGRW